MAMHRTQSTDGTGHRRRPTGSSRLLLGVVLAVALVAAACGSSSKSGGTTAATGGGVAANDGGTPVDGGSLVIGISADTNGWNPALAQWADTGALVGSSVLEPLATAGEDSGAKPWLADSWIANDTFTQWIIKLHPGVKFHDGTDFDAAAVKKNIDYYKTGTLSGIALSPILGDVTVQDPLTVIVNVKQPWAAFPSAFLDAGSSFMMAPSMIDNPTDHGASHPVGTGPYVFDSWTPDASFKATKNPNYWQPGLPHLDSIEFQVIPDETTRSNALKSGDVNMIYTTRASDANEMANDFQVIKDWTTEQAFVMTNAAAQVGGKANPLSNIHARQALAYATDPTAVAATIGDGVEVPTSMWSPPSPWSMPKDQNGALTTNLDQAKREVDAYKADTGAASLDITLSGLPTIDDTKVLQLLDSQWKQVGINVTIDSLEQTAYITKIALGNYQAAFFRNYGYPDPDLDYYFFSSTTAKGAGQVSINFTEYTTPQMDTDLTTGRSSGYPNIRKAAYDDLVKQVNASATNIWLYSTPYSFIADKQVHGLSQAEKIPFGNYMPKTWLGQLWRAKS
jgi:peptide/nickel transport system substrate-binding protein